MAVSDLRRWLLLSATGVAIVGVVVFVVPRSLRLPPTVISSSEGEWISRAPRKETFTAHIRETAGEVDWLSLTVRLLDRYRETVAGSSPNDGAADRGVRLALRANRVTRTGLEYDATAVLTYEPGESLLRLEVERGGTRFAYDVQLGQGEVQRVTLEAPGAAGTSRSHELGSGDGWPLGIGDLRIDDAVAFFRSVPRGFPEPVGSVDAAGATALMVFEVGMEIDPAAGGSNPEGARDRTPDAIDAASALVYIDPAEIRLRAVRVFGGSDRLVRAYDGFVYEDESSLVPAAFRATSIPTASHTDFRLESLELGGRLLVAPPGR